jgi:hypothetical protein
MTPINLLGPWDDQLFLSAIVDHKLSLADVISFLIVLRRPYLVPVGTPFLALLVLIGTYCVEAGVEFAHCLEMCEFATLSRAVRTVAAQWHRWVAKRTLWICAVWEEFAVLLRLMRFSLGGGRMASDALAVLAGCFERTDVMNIDSRSRWSRWGLMCKWTVRFGALEVEFANGIRGCLRAARGGFAIAHLDVGVCGVFALVPIWRARLCFYAFE